MKHESTNNCEIVFNFFLKDKTLFLKNKKNVSFFSYVYL